MVGLALVTAAFAVRADQIKANNNTALEVGASWTSGVAPSGGDAAVWDSTVALPASCTNTLGAAATWNSIVIHNPAAGVLITGSGSLTLSNGIDLTAAAVNLTLNCAAVNLAGNQTWGVASGVTLTSGGAGASGSINSPNNGNFTVTKTGGGVWTMSGNGDNGSTGVLASAGTVNLNKASSSGAHSVGGPGLAINAGAVARITGTGGDQIYDGATVTVGGRGLFDLNGNNETIGGLSGSGGNVDTTASGKWAVLTVGGSLGNGSSTFGGSLQNSASGARLGLVKAGTGTLTLSGANSYTGGTTISAGILVVGTTNNAAMAYTNAGGTLCVLASSSASSLPMTGLVLSGAAAQLSFNLGGGRKADAPLVTNSGNLTLNGNVPVNVANVARAGTYVLLQYAGSRNGGGSFVAGTLPSGASITDDALNKRLTLTYVSALAPRVIIPSLNSNEIVVAITTPQQYGAKGDGISDDTAAFQNAMNAVFNSGGSGGGVVFVPVGQYAFYTNLTIPSGVTLHGDWCDWTRSGAGMSGTTFKVYGGAGLTTNAAFITLSGSTALKGVNIWYPNQSAANIVPYPFTIRLAGDCVVQNVALVNSYQGIQSAAPSGGDKHILRTVIGSPLCKGIDLDQIFDVGHAEDIRFSPDVWPDSLVSNAPARGGAHAAWMRANGEAMRLLRVDGEMCMDTFISGYNVGIEANAAYNGQPGAAFYSGSVSNCGTALLAQDMPSGFGLMFSRFNLDGDIAINRTNAATFANAVFDHCLIIGRKGPAVSSTGIDWRSWMQFQDCAISNALSLAGPGVFNLVGCSLLGSTQCVLSASATRAAFTGCTFSPATNLVNYGNASNLLLNAHAPAANTPPGIEWTNVMRDAASRRPARTNLYVATDAQWGAAGNGSDDDTTAIQSALNAAGAGGGGLVYLPAGKYPLTNSLTVPPGVELRGAFEARHGTMPGADGHAKGTILEPLGGKGAANGPAAVVLLTNSGLSGVTISYETQDTNCFQFPPAIQGRGGNIYAVGVCSPNPYSYVDLNSWCCTNHFIDMVDGWALKTGFSVGNGSSGTIVDCHGNWTYWVVNYDSLSSLPQSIQAPVLDFTAHKMEMYVLGDCSELMVKDFSIIENTYLHCISQAGRGPNVTLVGNYCDGTIQGFVLDAAAACRIDAINTPICVFNFGNSADLAQSTAAVRSTTNFQGVARFTSSVLWAGPYLDFDINGGDVGVSLMHMENHAFLGSVINGGNFHLVNNSAYITYNGPNNFPPYNLAFGANAGLAGQRAEFIGCYAYNGCSFDNPGGAMPVDIWNDYALAQYSLLTDLSISGLYPNGNELFQSTNVLSFVATSPAGIAGSNISVVLDGVAVTNLVISGSSTSRSVTCPGLAVDSTHTGVITVTDANGTMTSTTVYFDTFQASDYQWEAEDYDYTSGGVGGLFFDNPQTNAYSGLASTTGVDNYQSDHNASPFLYRPSNGPSTTVAGDGARSQFGPGKTDYNIGFFGGGSWCNYTRHYPAGMYFVWGRFAEGAGNTQTTLSQVTAGYGTASQSTKLLGTFMIPSSGGWSTWEWAQLQSASGGPAVFVSDGSASTLRLAGSGVSGQPEVNVNFLMLAPAGRVTLSASRTGGITRLSFPTQTGLNYQMLYKDRLGDSAWIPLSSAITGNGATQVVTDAAASTCRFYRVQVAVSR